jgi:hypothetical protein
MLSLVVPHVFGHSAPYDASLPLGLGRGSASDIEGDLLRRTELPGGSGGEDNLRADITESESEEGKEEDGNLRADITVSESEGGNDEDGGETETETDREDGEEADEEDEDEGEGEGEEDEGGAGSDDEETETASGGASASGGGSGSISVCEAKGLRSDAASDVEGEANPSQGGDDAQPAARSSHLLGE